MRLFTAILFTAALALGAGTFTSERAAADFELTADPGATQWKGVAGVFAENNAMGKPTPGHRTEIRSVWTDKHIYFLFICPYEELYLKPNPVTDAETHKLWDWDVAEVFVGSDFEDIKHYYEFQVSPQGEWIDLDIHSDRLDADNNRKWESGYTVKARVDRSAKVWYGEMKIPIGSIDPQPARAGNRMRINLYRLQGPPPNRKQVTWQPTHRRSHHTPESFGILVLGK